MKGLYGKYKIEKADGSDLDPKAKYFVLRYDGNRVAEQSALMKYVESIEVENKKLSRELFHDIKKEYLQDHDNQRGVE